MKYTPGPWRITKAGYDDNLMFKVQVGNSERTVAYAYSPTGDSTPEQTANAQLIAAAPELLEFLAEGFDKVGAIVDGFSEESSPHNYTLVLNDNLLCLKQWMEDAAIAIAKARGEK